MRVLVVVPTYNEVDNIGTLIDRVHEADAAVDVLVVDDGSPDGTADLVATRGAADQRVHLLARSAKSGLGAAYRAGFRWGMDRGYEVLVEMDADLQHDPAALPDLIDAVEAGADLAVGSRYVPGGSIPSSWPWHRRALSKWANRYAGAMLGLELRDATAGYRAYRAPALALIPLDEVRADGYCFQIEMADRVARDGGTITERPIRFGEREHGDSKMSWRIVVEAMALVTWWGIRRRLPGGPAPVS